MSEIPVQKALWFNQVIGVLWVFVIHAALPDRTRRIGDTFYPKLYSFIPSYKGQWALINGLLLLRSLYLCYATQQMYNRLTNNCKMSL